MMNTGYSGSPLISKLGITSAMKLFLVDPPPEYDQWIGLNTTELLAGEKEAADFIHLFITDATTLLSAIPEARKRMHAKSMLWVSWYKKSAKMGTNITEDTIRAAALANGLVDVKVCSVSDLWSGLKLLIPLSLRK